MAKERIQVTLSTAQLRALDKLGDKYLLDRANTVRYLISRALEEEKIKVE